MAGDGADLLRVAGCSHSSDSDDVAAGESSKGDTDTTMTLLKFVDMRTLQVDAAGCTTCPSGMGASYSYGSPSDDPTPYPLFGEGVTRGDVNAVDWNDADDIKEAILATLLPGITWSGLIPFPRSTSPATASNR